MTDELQYFTEEMLEDAIVEVKVKGNIFECLHCGQEHTLSDDGWEVDGEFFNVPIKSFNCVKCMYYVFMKTDEGIVNFIYGLDYIPMQDGELKDGTS